MRLLQAPAALGLAAAIRGSLLGRRRRGREPFEARLNKGQDMTVFDRARCGDDGGGGAVSAAQIVVDRRPVEGHDALPRAENRPADWLIGPSGRGEKIEHQVIRRVFDRPDLLEDHILFPFELFQVECAIGEKVANDVEREIGVAPENSSEVARSLELRSQH